jgi:hypothetical protein
MSALTCVRFWGFENQTLDLWIHEVAKSDLLICKEGGSHEDYCGCIFPDREIKYVKVLRAV